jgi:RNA polymerase sigma-70 factor, ECF subfamily
MTGSRDSPVVEDEDATLVEHARRGDVRSFEKLLMRHADGLYRVLRRLGLDHGEAQDAAQETFLRAWRSLSRFEGRSRFFTWLYRIGFNEAQRRLAKRPTPGTVVSSEERPLDDQAETTAGPAESVEREELRAALAASLAELPTGLRAPVILRDVEGLSTREAASVLDLGEAAFKSRLHRGRMALRALLGPRLIGPHELG